MRRDCILALTLMAVFSVVAAGVWLAEPVDDPVPHVSAAASGCASHQQSPRVVAAADLTAALPEEARASMAATASVRADATTICLAGRFCSPYDRSTVAKWLGDEGFEVRDATVEPVALALVGDDPLNADATGFDPVEGTPQYKAAVAHGARLIRLRDVRARVIR